MICRLSNIADVSLMLGFDSGRENLLRPGDDCFYDDSKEILLDDCWDFVEWGWIKDEDYESLVEKHDWALEGF